MYYAANAIKYLKLDETCCYSTLVDDIDKTFDAIESGKGNTLTHNFINWVNSYLMLKTEDCKRFAEFMMMQGYPYEYQNINLYYFMPFRYAKCPMADKRILERVMKTKDLPLDQAIMGLIGYYHPERFNCNQDFLNKMNFFFNFQQITWGSIGRDQKLANLGYMPLDMDRIVYDYRYILQHPEDPLHFKKIGNYGELLFYRRLQNELQNGEQVMWISHNLGDGFGYDVAVYDPKANYLYLYEVKATDQLKNYNQIQLTEYENRIKNLMKDSTDTEYHVVKIYLGTQIQMVDINTKNDGVKDLMVPDNNHILIKKKDGFDFY